MVPEATALDGIGMVMVGYGWACPPSLVEGGKK